MGIFCCPLNYINPIYFPMMYICNILLHTDQWVGTPDSFNVCQACIRDKLQAKLSQAQCQGQKVVNVIQVLQSLAKVAFIILFALSESR